MFSIICSLSYIVYSRQVSYAEWFLFAFPLVWIQIIICWVYMCSFTLNIGEIKDQNERQKEIQVMVKAHYDSLGSLTFSEKSVLFIFSSMLFFWFFRDPGFIAGWADVFTDNPKYVLGMIF